MATATLLEDIITELVELGEVSGDGIDCFRDFAPPTPDDCCIFYEYMSGDPLIHTNIVHRSIQVVSRSNSAAIAKAKADSLYIKLNPLDRQMDIVDRKCIISPRNTPRRIKIDEKNRVYYAFNLGVVTSRDEV